MYPSKLQRNKANTYDTKASMLYLHLFICNEIYDKRDDFGFEIVNFTF